LLFPQWLAKTMAMSRSARRPLGSLLPALALAAGLVGAASAQEPAGEPPAAEAPQGTPGEAPAQGAPAETAEGAERPSNAAFMQPLGRLANILGSMHFLRTLCGDEDGGVWRDKMNELIAAQRPNEADRRILIAQFNSGYRAFEATYRQCTPAADLATRRYLEEGASLSREIGVRYGN
jgi:uncharacterized protein (TIGR02301 family)